MQFHSDKKTKQKKVFGLFVLKVLFKKKKKVTKFFLLLYFCIYFFFHWLFPQLLTVFLLRMMVWCFYVPVNVFVCISFSRIFSAKYANIVFVFILFLLLCCCCCCFVLLYTCVKLAFSMYGTYKHVILIFTIWEICSELSTHLWKKIYRRVHGIYRVYQYQKLHVHKHTRKGKPIFIAPDSILCMTVTW